ncbi:hypothetical protein EXU85_22485 [Spirosoma sp. KCTC 42546]|uniref:hypothetical protein n=1 Tax=Spirosoma sp. KCTC 42546 TaxID=2520506 RepID=UPI00115B8BB1|nr:hypothetical protein [Spirosoma sp. KCTC 42546]QDK81224.1 hypothetical protein EXU85_22485 [Spirosoma sp. KCTC 42546]
MEDILQNLGSNPWTIITSNFYTAVFAGLILWIGYKLGKDDGSYILNWLISLLGVLIGWIIGILATPYDSLESQKFLTIGQSISVFLSGYVISKLDRFFEASLYQDGNPKKESWIRLGLFTVSFLLTLIIVFVNRSYFDYDAKSKKIESKVKKLEAQVKGKQKSLDSLAKSNK